jgi:predicted metal-binding membrane protein
MGRAVAAFLLVWLLMMVAMMPSAVTPVDRLKIRTISQDRRALRVACFLRATCLCGQRRDFPHSTWSGARNGSQLSIQERPGLQPQGLLAVAAHRVSPLKDVCLKACPSPMGLLLR